MGLRRIPIDAEDLVIVTSHRDAMALATTTSMHLIATIRSAMGVRGLCIMGCLLAYLLCGTAMGHTPCARYYTVSRGEDSVRTPCTL